MNGFFSFPVTDSIAPGYSNIIHEPMDFSTMKAKIEANEYHSVTEYKVHEQREVTISLKSNYLHLKYTTTKCSNNSNITISELKSTGGEFGRNCDFV